MTGAFAGEIYDHLETKNLLPEEQKGYSGTMDHLLILKMFIKRTLTNL